jgi:hypothetical protein
MLLKLLIFTLLLVKDIPEAAVGFTLQSRLRQPAVDFYLAFSELYS